MSKNFATTDFLQSIIDTADDQVTNLQTFRHINHRRTVDIGVTDNPYLQLIIINY